ncbi:MAG TPA: hypothetical protein VMB52_00290 [Verrucomicrobiae bacterium]|nr:hypothetical protein [Verrucomicrobiae bacterium]
MLGRKPQPTSAQTNERRRVASDSNVRPFSYYTSRISGNPEPKREPTRRLQRTEAEPQQQPVKSSARVWLTGWAFWFLVLVAAVCAGKILLLSSSPKVIIVGETQITASYMQPNAAYASAAQKVLASSITNRSKLTVDPAGVATTLEKEFPELLNVSMNIPLVGNRPVLYLQPATPVLVIQAPDGNYALNRDGIILSRLHEIPADVPEVVDQSSLTLQVGKQALSSGAVAFINTVAYQFAAQHLTISTFVLPANAPYELDVRLEGQSYIVRFNLEADALIQCGAAVATIQQLGNKPPSTYLDVRVPGRVYYK